MAGGDIELQGVTVNFPYEQGVVLADISCRFPAGEVSAILYESGSGKSVLGKAVLRLLDRAEIEGSIRLGNVELTALSEGALRTIRGRSLLFAAGTLRGAESLSFHRLADHRGVGIPSRINGEGSVPARERGADRLRV